MVIRVTTKWTTVDPRIGIGDEFAAVSCCLLLSYANPGKAVRSMIETLQPESSNA